MIALDVSLARSMGFEGVKERKKKKSEKKKGDVENQKMQKVQKSEISILFFNTSS